MRRRIVIIDLEDVFAQIGFDHFAAVAFKCLVHVDFFGHH